MDDNRKSSNMKKIFGVVYQHSNYWCCIYNGANSPIQMLYVFKSLYVKMKQDLVFPFFDTIVQINPLVQLNSHISKVLNKNQNHYKGS
jgi:hypothetical protein